MAKLTAVERLLEVARNEIGYLEKETNSNLDNKTANAGDNNWNKYARDLDKTNLYNGKKNGYSWCDIFVDWCFVTAFGYENALKLTCQPEKGCGAGCTYSARFYMEKGQFYKSDPKPGDQIFYTDDGGKTHYHTGIVEKVDESRVYTIEGNTSSKPGVVANGGSVEQKSHKLNSSFIGGYGRPDYSLIDKSETITIAEESVKYPTPKAATVIEDVVNVRIGPSTNYAKIGTITEGSSLNVVGADNDGKWYKFSNETYESAWIYAEYVRIDVSEVKYPNPKNGQVQTKNSNLNVRKGPDLSYDRIGGLTNNTMVTVTAVSSDNKWYKISTKKYPSGWVSAEYIALLKTNAVYKEAVGNVYIRTGRGNKNKAIGIIPRGAKVEVSDLKSNWYKVKYRGIEGYTIATYLK